MPPCAKHRYFIIIRDHANERKLRKVFLGTILSISSKWYLTKINQIKPDYLSWLFIIITFSCICKFSCNNSQGYQILFMMGWFGSFEGLVLVTRVVGLRAYKLLFPKIHLCSKQSLCTQLPFITFASKLKSFYFHSCSVCTIGKLFILSLARVPPLHERIITGDGWAWRNSGREQFCRIGRKLGLS